MSFEFFLTSPVVILLPGTGVLYTVAIGLGRGIRQGIAAASGSPFGIIPAEHSGSLHSGLPCES